ncbi:MAG: LysR family transcriptional regulator [Caulobacterales bacterium]
MQSSANDEGDLWRRLDWNDVRTFLAVAESGSLNAAARALAITQPTISRRMEELEYRLGASLFVRSSRGIVLTEAGENVRDLAASMARFGESIVKNVAGRDKALVGRVRVAAPDGLASYILVPELPAFQMANPTISLSIDCGLWPSSPLDGETDLSLSMAEETPGDVVSIPIATTHYALFASPEYLRVYGTPKSFAEAADHRWIHHSSHREQQGTWHPKASATVELAGQQLVSNSSATTLQAVKHGVGLCSLPTYVLTFEPGLVMLDLEPLAHPILYLRHRAAAERQGRVKRVKEWLMGLFDPVDKPWYRHEFIHPRDFDRARRRVPSPRVVSRA